MAFKKRNDSDSHIIFNLHVINWKFVFKKATRTKTLWFPKRFHDTFVKDLKVIHGNFFFLDDIESRKTESSGRAAGRGSLRFKPTPLTWFLPITDIILTQNSLKKTQKQETYFQMRSLFYVSSWIYRNSSKIHQIINGSLFKNL